jgi:hypothetical protein
MALVDRWKRILRRALDSGGLGAKWLGTRNTKSTGDGGAEMVFLKGDGLPRAIEHAAKAVDLSAYGVRPFAGGFQFVLHCLATFLLDVSVADLLLDCGESRRRMPFFISLSSRLSITCESDPSSFWMRLVFSTSTFRMRSSGRCV